MYIKRIIIQGFKTYKEATVIDLLSPHTNVVVGRNGSGKSNFFAAIRFVLSDAYTQMSKEERRGLIHEGSGTVMSAYVEIVFDNIDRRFPLDRDEVSIRRTIGLKKDDYSIDDRSVQRGDVMNLLESAGFSKSNPYYIVPQGRITALTNAKDSQRLQLLKEVAGAQVFEQKLKQSLKEMDASEKQREKIDEMLRFIEERLDDLDSERAELKEFQELEKDKKFLEYALYDRELTDIESQIERNENLHSNNIDESGEFAKNLDQREISAMQIEELLTELKSNINVMKVDKSQNELDINDLLIEVAKQKEMVGQLENQEENLNEEIKIDNANLKETNEEIKKKEDYLSLEQPRLGELKELEKNLKDKLNDLIGRQRTLYSKQSRKSRFKNQKDRDAWLNSNIDEMNQVIDDKENSLNVIKDRRTELENKLILVDEETKKIHDQLSGLEAKEESSKLYNAINDARQNYSDLVDERKQLWRLEARQRTIIQSANEEFDKARRFVGETMDRSQASGLDAVERIAQKLGLSNGVYGPLGELIEVSQKYKVAAEVIAGNSLFHIVVDNDNTASAIMEELVRERSGRVTFMPLNRLHPYEPQLPNSIDCIPLISKIEVGENFLPAVKEVYGRTIVTRSLEIGSSLAREYKITAITLDGDRADQKGVLTGGYRDHKRSRIDTLSIQRRRKAECDEAAKELHELKRKIEAIDQKITAASGEVTNAQKRYDALMFSKEPLKTRLTKFNNDKLNLNQEIQSLDSIIDSNERIINQYKQQNQSYQDELKAEFAKNLTNEEIEELKNITNEITNYEKELGEISKELISKELKVSSIESELNEKLYPRRDQFLISDNSKNMVFKTQLIEAQDKLKNLETTLKELTESSNKLRAKIEEAEAEIRSKQKILDKVNEARKALEEQLSGIQKVAEKNVSKKSLLLIRQADLQKKIGELGALPQEAFDKYGETGTENILRKLNLVNKKLTKFDHINRKALEQFQNFSKERKELLERRDESDKSKESIENLITVLEKRKNKAIVGTFKQLSEEFSIIFEKLVPAGIGKLILQKKTTTEKDQVTLMTQGQDDDGDASMTDSNNDNDDDENIDDYIGISIQVSFNSKSDEQQRIEQLSGGQKSLCAITLILAIQKCDPAPFYLFDEIDANLDTQYRTDVAALIQELSTNAQFICTTFRPELLEVADKYFGIMFNKKISKVSEITKEDAAGFIEGQQQKTA